MLLPTAVAAVVDVVEFPLKSTALGEKLSLYFENCHNYALVLEFFEYQIFLKCVF